MYNKIFTKILDSSIWLESLETRIVWLTFIAAMDEDGFVQFASEENVAHRARVSLDAVKKAIKTLESPDKNSSDEDNEGRRVERVPGGWVVLNAEKYHKIVLREHQKLQTRERVRQFRERAKVKRSGNVPVTPSDTEELPHDQKIIPAKPGNPLLSAFVKTWKGQFPKTKFPNSKVNTYLLKAAIPKDRKPEESDELIDGAFEEYLVRIADPRYFNAVKFASAWRVYLEPPKGAS